MTRITAEEAARWMLAELESTEVLYQSVMMCSLPTYLTHENSRGEWSISREVLLEFRNLTKGEAIWDKDGKCWRWKKGQKTTRQYPHSPEGTRGQK
jgi:hypothetical protein